MPDWLDVGEYNGTHRITFSQAKTGTLQYLDITPQAYGLLGDAAEEGRVFVGLKYSAYVNLELKR